jgi:hypothetical protein
MTDVGQILCYLYSRVPRIPFKIVNQAPSHVPNHVAPIFKHSFQHLVHVVLEADKQHGHKEVHTADASKCLMKTTVFWGVQGDRPDDRGSKHL